ncbi:MAG: hypothetical protein JNN05_01455 [Candidatus Omnitrophica bacterium]|nr:hypothetical protein [Candidatus Omnitrophota bacterium]
MKKHLLSLSVFLFMTVFSNLAHAQWDLRGCSQYGASIFDATTVENSLWTFRSNVWDGYIDFQEDGKYWTHWGYGTWKIDPETQTIALKNDYNEKTYRITLTDSGFRFEGYRNDGMVISGKLICARYQGEGPKVPDDVSAQIKAFFKSGYERDPTDKELVSLYRLFLQDKTIEQIIEYLKSQPEYLQKQAARDEKLRQMEANGELQW